MPRVIITGAYNVNDHLRDVPEASRPYQEPRAC